MDDFYYLSEAEKQSVAKFLADPSMKEAVRKVLLSCVYYDGTMEEDRAADPLKNFILAYFTNPQKQLLPAAEKGMLLETIINSVSLVESGFKQLEKLKPLELPELKGEKNKGR